MPVVEPAGDGSGHDHDRGQQEKDQADRCRREAHDRLEVEGADQVQHEGGDEVEEHRDHGEHVERLCEEPEVHERGLRPPLDQRRTPPSPPRRRGRTRPPARRPRGTRRAGRGRTSGRRGPRRARLPRAGRTRSVPAAHAPEADTRSAAATTTTPIGMLMKKTYSHPNASTIPPPTTGDASAADRDHRAQVPEGPTALVRGEGLEDQGGREREDHGPADRPGRCRRSDQDREGRGEAARGRRQGEEDDTGDEERHPARILRRCCPSAEGARSWSAGRP